MAVENKSQGTSSIVSVLAEPESVVQQNGIIPVGSDHTPKVRKPYTISKQREKWTEEEHQKFLEALKLYGRGWRQIEEHIGTKTAVQIRSHAQKFFSKVSRERPDSIDNSIKPLEIPPPRPKRKPVHPYPRKVVRSHDGVSVSFQPERSPSPNLKTSERQNQSPTSVLSANVSNALESPVSEQHSGCLSPASCTTDMHSINLLPVVKGNAYLTIGSSTEKERGSFSPVQTSAGSVEANAAFMKIDMGSKNTLCTKEDGTADAQSTTFKLFGKTVLVSDYQKPSASAMENVNARSSKDSQENYGIDNINSAYAPSNELNIEFSLGDIYTNWNQQPCGVPVFHSMGFQKDGSNTAVATTDACVPWWALYQGLSFACLPSYNQMPEDSGREEGMRENENHKEISCTGSNTGSVGEVESTEKNFDAVDSNCQHPLPEDRSNRSNCARGFVPYKRCLAERNISSSVVVEEEREGQRIRVCS